MAVTLATALSVAAAAVLGTIHGSLRHAVGEMTGFSDVIVRHRYGDRIRASLLDMITTLPEVERITGRFGTATTLHHTDSGGQTHAVAIGVELERDAALNPLSLVAGRPARRGDEMVIDQFVAEKLGAEVGDSIEAESGGGFDLLAGLADRMLGYRRSLWSRDPGSAGRSRFQIVGIAKRERLQILQRPSAMIAIDRAYSLAGLDDVYDTIHVKLADGVDAQTFRDRYESALPRDVRFQTAAGLSSGANRALRAMRLAELVINLVVLLSCAMLILTGLTTAVEQRQRELALLRCIGATRGQIAMSQLLCGLLLTICAIAPALPLGLFLGYLIIVRHADTLIGGFAPDGRGMVIAVVAALLAGLLGAAYPACRAMRISPLRAMTTRAAPASSRGVIACLVIGLAFAATQPVAMLLRLPKDLVFWIYLYAGIALTFIGYFLLSVPLTAVLARVLGPILARFLRVPEDLLRQSVGATTVRHGFTGASLMVGVAMLVSTWMGGRSLVSDWLSNVKLPDGFVHSPFPMTDRQWQRLQSSSAISSLCPTTAFKVELQNVRFGATDIVPPHTLFSCFNPREFFLMTEMDWVQGDRESALKRLDEGRAVLVSREYLVAHGIGVGSKLTVLTEVSGPVEFDVVGVVSSPGLDVAVSFFGIHRYYADAAVSTIFGTRADAARYFHNETINLVLVRFRPDLTNAEAMVQLRKDVDDFMIVGSASNIRGFVDAVYAGLLATASSVAVAMLLMACFGLGNIIIANLTARRFEFGVLRGVGAPRSLLARLVMAETLLIAAVGCVLGTGLGVQSSLIEHEFMRRLYGLDASPRIPWDVIVLGCATATLLALLATLPAVWHLMRVHPRALLAVGREG